MITFLVGIVLVFALAGCGGNDDNSDPSLSPGLPGPAEQIDQGSGWPSAKLSDYSLGGWGQPTGISGISWEERQAGGEDYYMFTITFTSATAATKDSINGYLEPWASATPNWIQNEQNTFEVTYQKVVGSFQYSVYVSYNTSLGNFIQLTRVSGMSELQ